MPTRDFTGTTAPAGVQFPDVFDKDGNLVHAGRTVPYQGEPIEVEDHEAALLDDNPDWGGTAPDDKPAKKRSTKPAAKAPSKETD